MRSSNNKDESSDFIYTINIEQVAVKPDPTGWKITPILEVRCGSCSTDDAGNIADDGSEYIEEVYKVLKDKIKVPCIIHSSLVDVNIIYPVV